MARTHELLGHLPHRSGYGCRAHGIPFVMAKPERYWSKKSPEGATYDVIVIGSGMGGMTTASMLARLGQKVLVLEQHYVPGGFTHVFSRKGFTWDVGVHAIGEVTEHPRMANRNTEKSQDQNKEKEPK